MTVAQEKFGIVDGREVDIFTLSSASGVRARLTNYGGIIVSLEVPDRAGRPADVILGFDTLDGYLQKHPFFGALVGRYANRIGDGRFALDGRTYTLEQNGAAGAHLHGGSHGYDKAVWEAEAVTEGGVDKLRLNHVSPDGDAGYPGTLTVGVVYSLDEQGRLGIEYTATSDANTVVNLTNHAYFNLAGHGSGDVLGHMLWIDADRVTPTDPVSQVPDGTLLKVEGTAYDFRTPKPIGRDAANTPDGFGGYDINYVLNSPAGTLRRIAEVTEPASGRCMEVLTTQPAVQLYTAFKLDGSKIGKGGVPYRASAGFCLETQHYPDSPNKPQFPSTVLRAGQVYRETTVYRFFAR